VCARARAKKNQIANRGKYIIIRFVCKNIIFLAEKIRSIEKIDFYTEHFSNKKVFLIEDLFVKFFFQ